MLLLIISATYAYFSVTITGNGSKTMITANTPKKHSLSVSTLYDDIHIHVDNNDMKLANVGSYYGAVDKDKRYETDLTTGTHNIIEVTSKGMENIRYSCSGDIKVTLNIDNGSMGSVLEKEDVLLYLKGLGLDETLDLSTLKINNTKIYKTFFEIDGDSSDYLSAIVELINKESYQNYIANKMLKVKIEAENMVCRENGTYKYLVKLNKFVTEKPNDKETGKWVSIFYNEEGIYQKIQNIYLVDYIDTTKAIKTWELGDTDRGTKSDEVMGWLEATPDENDRYDLYIGANGPMRAPKDMRCAFYQFTNLKKISGDALDTIEVTNMSSLFYQDTNLTEISALANWNTKNVISMNYLFYNNTNLTEINALKNWNVSNVTTMESMFQNCTNLTDISGLSSWDVSNVIYMNYIFDNCKNLINIKALKNWNVLKVTKMTGMFQSTKINDLTSLINWDTSNVTLMNVMFGSTQIVDLTPIENWNISSVTNMVGMFSTTPLSDLTPISEWDISNVTNMTQLFWGAQVSDLAPISNWKFEKEINLNNMFYYCPIVDISPLANWDVSNVTSMVGLFSNLKITDISPIANWDVSHVTNMYGLFSGTNITDFSAISNWDVSNVTIMYHMFSGSSISDLTPLKDWQTSKVTNMAGMFSSCKNITSLTGLGNWDVSKVTDMSNMFNDDSNLKDVTAIENWNPENVTILGEYGYGGMFSNCHNLTKLDLSKWQTPKLASVSRMFGGCTNLIELKLPQAPYNSISNVNSYQAFLGGEFVGAYNRGTMGSVKDNIAITVDATQESWIKARLVEANVTNATINGKPMSSIT